MLPPSLMALFFQPSDRQNFANALGQTCIHDLRLRHIGDLIESDPKRKEDFRAKNGPRWPPQRSPCNRLRLKYCLFDDDGKNGFGAKKCIFGPC